MEGGRAKRIATNAFINTGTQTTWRRCKCGRRGASLNTLPIRFGGFVYHTRHHIDLGAIALSITNSAEC